MKLKTIRDYLLNCFLLTIPILLWDFIYTDKLPKAFQPEVFWNNIPGFISYSENISRIILFVFMLFMPLQISTNLQKKGLALYTAGVFLYSLSWLILMYYPSSTWSKSVFGFSAPAYTPLLWLIGIGLIGNSFYFNLPHKRALYFFTVVVFIIFHNWHTYLIYLRMG